MLEDANGSKKDTQRNTMQRSNRVFILEYSPERSKSKKKNQWEGIEPRKEKLSSFLSRRDILENDPTQEMSHRRNIDRLTSLLSRARSSRETGEGESGCEKLVKAIEKIAKIKVALGEGMEALKKYSMLCSNSNYELFIQSKHHYNLKDKKQAEKLNTQLPSIHERYSFDQGHQSHHSSQLAPIKSPPQNEVTFRKKADSPLQNSILNGLDSPMKCLQPFRLSRECITTAQTLQSYSQLPYTLLPGVLPRLRSQMQCAPLLRQAPLVGRRGREQQFLHLCHLQSDYLASSKPEKEDNFQQVKQLLLSLDTQERSPLGSFTKGRLDFALPTPVSPQKNKISINYVTDDPIPDVKRSRKGHPVLTANQIAQKMLFGRGETAPEKAEIKATPAVKLQGEERGRKRVSSLPKITFTYSSREKDNPFQSPSAKCIFLPASPKAVIKAASPRKKDELQSTFASTQLAANTSNSRSGMKTPHAVEGASRVVRVVREPTSFNPFAGKPAASLQRVERMDSEYYGGIVQKNQGEEARQLRPRIVTQAVARDNQIQFVGIEQQPRGCCWTKQIRSKSLNDRVLVGLRH